MQWDRLFLSMSFILDFLATLDAGNDGDPVSDSNAGMESDDSEMAEVVNASESAESSTDYDSEAERKYDSDSDAY
jgi:hypothetical protein